MRLAVHGWIPEARVPPYLPELDSLPIPGAPARTCTRATALETRSRARARARGEAGYVRAAGTRFTDQDGVPRRNDHDMLEPAESPYLKLAYDH